MLVATSAQISSAAAVISGYVDDVAFLTPTPTNLKKHIFDATESVRRLLHNKQLHDYAAQQQGQEHKVHLPTFLVDANKKVSCQASLYRPNTKKGDPRIWFSNLARHVAPGSVLALVELDRCLYLINLSDQATLEAINQKQHSPALEVLLEIRDRETSVARELLSKLRKIAARGPIPTCVNADTGVGRTLETLLGIPMNSKKSPDYKGIELKASRKKIKGKENRVNLFAQVPNWHLSTLKSSRAIAERYGYDCPDCRKLYCTVSASKSNSQGLYLELSEDGSLLHEKHNDKETGQTTEVVKWSMETLTSRLKEKHKETFWIDARSVLVDGKEHFIYDAVTHTRNPVLGNFIPLLLDNKITLDHLIKIMSNGKVTEKGPIFKIEKDALGILIPIGGVYSLRT